MKWIAVLMISLFGAQAMAAQLSVEVAGIESDEGHIRLELYNDPKSFRKVTKALHTASLPAESGSVSFSFEKLDAGDYAVIVYHDADDNGKMNKILGMIPSEGYGLSSNPEVSGPPSFDDARFTLHESGGVITINLNY
ncbi:MAG TPA: DUF2141 domain-containing protein [Gammaproteobacteria bacterium]